MILFIIGIIVALVGLGWVAFGVTPRLGGVGVLILGLFITLPSFISQVDAKNYGVVTFGGKPVDNYGAGYHLKAPWEKVTSIDGTIQTRENTGDKCLYVKIGDGSRSCVSVTTRFQVQEEAAGAVFSDYRGDDPTAEVGDKLVSVKLKRALQDTLSDYNPVANLQVVQAGDAGAGEVSFAPDYGQMSEDLFEDMLQRLEEAGDLVELLSIDVTYVTISDNTQKQLDDFNKALGATAIAQQNLETSTAQAAANVALAESLSNPSLIPARCLDALNAAIEKGYALPAGFNCIGGSSAVVVPSAK